MDSEFVEAALVSSFFTAFFFLYSVVSDP
uniref:Uncharacterized protein n=1 Tax=Arundo donax TaxID=35708 RepID=A0A0A9FWH0_ARUDO